MQIWNTEQIIKKLKKKVDDIKEIIVHGPLKQEGTQIIELKFKHTSHSLFVRGIVEGKQYYSSRHVELNKIALSDNLEKIYGKSNTDINFSLHYLQCHQLLTLEEFEVLK